jgi:hypothetical protein
MLQEIDYEGWPESNSELPIDSMTQEHKDALISKCSRKKDIPMPNFAAEEKTEEMAVDTPTSDETCNDKERDPSKVIESTDTNASIINDADGNEANGDQGEEAQEVWDVRKVMSIADVNDCPIKCSTETCTLAAACVYVSNLAPTEKWYTCLDCQVSNMRRHNNGDLSCVNRLFAHTYFF